MSGWPVVQLEFYIRTGIMHARATEAALLGGLLEEGLQGVSRSHPEGDGRRAVCRPVGRYAGIGQAVERCWLGVYELVGDHRGNTFRAVYTVRMGDAVHVLHA